MIIRPRWTLVALASVTASAATWFLTADAPGPMASKSSSSVKAGTAPSMARAVAARVAPIRPPAAVRLEPALGGIAVPPAQPEIPKDLGRPDAEALLSAAIAATPGDARLYLQMASVVHSRGRWAEAVVLLEKALEKNAEFTEAWMTLGMVQAERGRYSQAAAALTRGVACDPEDMGMRYQLALIHARLGEHQKAIEGLRAASQCTPPVAGAAAALARLSGQPGIAAVLRKMELPRTERGGADELEEPATSTGSANPSQAGPAADAALQAEVARLTQRIQDNPADLIAVNNLAILHSRDPRMATFADALFGVLESYEPEQESLRQNIETFRQYRAGKAREVTYGRTGEVLTLGRR